MGRHPDVPGGTASGRNTAYAGRAQTDTVLLGYLILYKSRWHGACVFGDSSPRNAEGDRHDRGDSAPGNGEQSTAPREDRSTAQFQTRRPEPREADLFLTGADSRRSIAVGAREPGERPEREFPVRAQTLSNAAQCVGPHRPGGLLRLGSSPLEARPDRETVAVPILGDSRRVASIPP